MIEFLKTFLYLDYHASLRALIDIFIVSVLFYSLYMALRRTRGFQLVIGIGSILLLGSFANYFELELLDWIISSVRPALLFLAIVLLQPELRRAFAELTNTKFFKLFNIKPNYEIDEIIEAVRIMASEKTGSIIAISKEISLRNIIEQSVQLDAIITSALLLTIFKKNTALHDGAVIIEQNRIASAASYLPMSNQLGTSSMGARHRSALGLAEETDAVVIVTSEETGEISVCHDGRMIHPVKPFELKTLVLNLLLDIENKESSETKIQSNLKEVRK